MSKNTENNAFRTVDVDQYNEDNYKEEEVAEPYSVEEETHQQLEELQTQQPVEVMST